MEHEERIIGAIFIISTIFFLYQHSTGYSWDFSVYSMNAQYFAGSGHYFEWLRPPLAPAIMAFFSVLGQMAAEYFFIIIVSITYLYSCMIFAGKYRINRAAFYVFSLSVFTLAFGMKAGTEMLSLSLMQFFLAHLYEKKSGIFLGLSVLARYSSIIFIILLVFQKNIKKITISFMLCFIVISPWLFYNWYHTGSPLTSIAEQYGQNSKFRTEMKDYFHGTPEFSPLDLLLAVNITLPLMLLGIYARIRKLSKHDMAVLFVLAVSLLIYTATPLKEPRYLFLMVLPAAYFSTISLEKFVRKKWHIFVLVSFAIISLALLVFYPYQNEEAFFYKNVAAQAENCSVKSDIWVPLNYYGAVAEPLMSWQEINYSIEQGYRIIFTKISRELGFAGNQNLIDQFPKISEGYNYVILGKGNCTTPKKYELSYLEKRRQYYLDVNNTIFDADPCRVLLPAFLCP
jgi:hypothetical protein